MRPKTAAERLQRQTLGSGGIFKSAAVHVLRLERRLMSTGSAQSCFMYAIVYDIDASTLHIVGQTQNCFEWRCL